MKRISINEEPSDHEAYIAEVDNSLSENLSDLFLISHDIFEAGTNVKNFILNGKIFQKSFEIEPNGIWKIDFADTEIDTIKENVTIQACIWESALIKYARCFSDSRGKRIRLETDKIFLEKEKIDAHYFFINLRNKHISHPVGILEMGKTGMRLSQIHA